MPIELNGTYWTVDEIADVTGKTYSTIFYKLPRYYEVIKIKGTVLIPEEIAQKIIEDEESGFLALPTIARGMSLAMTKIQKIIDAGLPLVKDARGKVGLLAQDYKLLRRAYLKAITKKGWALPDTPKDVVKFFIEMQEKEARKNELPIQDD